MHDRLIKLGTKFLKGNYFHEEEKEKGEKDRSQDSRNNFPTRGYESNATSPRLIYQPRNGLTNPARR